MKDHTQARRSLELLWPHLGRWSFEHAQDVKNLVASLDAEIAELKARMAWQPMQTAPEGEHVLYYFARGEKGAGGMEALTMYKNDDGTMVFWTHGGPNSGGDYDINEIPIAWMPLPEPPEAA